MAGIGADAAARFDEILEEMNANGQAGDISQSVKDKVAPLQASSPYQADADESTRIARAAPQLSEVMSQVRDLESEPPPPSIEAAKASLDAATQAALSKLVDHCWLRIGTLPPELQDEVLASWQGLDAKRFPLSQSLA